MWYDVRMSKRTPDARENSPTGESILTKSFARALLAQASEYLDAEELPLHLLFLNPIEGKKLFLKPKSVKIGLLLLSKRVK